MLFFSVNWPCPQQEVGPVSPPLGSGWQQRWCVTSSTRSEAKKILLEHPFSCNTYSLLAPSQNAATTEPKPHGHFRCQGPCQESQLLWVTPIGIKHMSEEASRWFQPPSHLSVPSWDPRQYTADTRHHHCVASNFLTHRICEHKKMIIILHQVGAVCHKAPGSWHIPMEFDCYNAII